MTAAKTPGTALDVQHVFSSLSRNAFDFLERGIAEFDKAPKYSVIHFCAAAEMFIKARLLQEHWSLIVSKPEKANLGKFMAGDFASVTMDEARERIRDIAGEEITDNAFNSLRALATHRNKMIHFFHAGIETNEKDKSQIVAEQCRAWFHLHRLLNRWDAYFSDFRANIARADRLMKSHRKYLGEKFNALKQDLDGCRESGNSPKVCSACGFSAAIPEAVDSQIAIVRCRVCDLVETRVELECPHCKEMALVTSGGSKCQHCGGEIDSGHIVDNLADHGAALVAAMDGDDGFGDISCGACSGYQTVVARGEKYFCVDCFEISGIVQSCGWCNGLNTGDMEHSYAKGCDHCDGRLGWEKDD